MRSPFSGHERLIASISQNLLERRHAVIQVAFVARLPLEVGAHALSHGSNASNMVMVGSPGKNRMKAPTYYSFPSADFQQWVVLRHVPGPSNGLAE